MKATKRFFALALALIMVLALGTAAFADDAPSDGSITISNTTAGADYSVYKIFDLTYSSPVEYAADGAATTPVAYTYTTSDPDTDGHTNDAVYVALTGTGTPFTLTPTTKKGVYNVSVAKETTGDTIRTFLQTNIIHDGNGDTAESLIAPKGTKENVAGGELKFENLPYGYYYITSSLGTVVTLDSTLKDVTVIDKNQEPTWDNEDPDNPDTKRGKVIIDDVPHCGKEVGAEGHTEHTEECYKTTVNSAHIGENVTFDIGINATSNVKDEYVMNYYIKDDIEPGFDYVVDDAGKPVVTITLDGTTTTAYTLVAVTNEDGKVIGFEIAIPWADETVENSVVTAITSKHPGNAQIHVQYSATVNADAELAKDTNDNTADFTYDTNKPGNKPNDPYDPENPPEDPEDKPWTGEDTKTTKTYVYAIGIQKVDDKGKPLAGAQFSVVKKTKDTEGKDATVTIKATAELDDNSNAIPGVYKYNPSGTDKFETNDQGILIIKGVDDGTYTITEEVAPNGYNKLTQTLNVTAELTNAGTYTTTYTYFYDKDGNLVDVEEKPAEGSEETYTFSANVTPIVVQNKAGVELPSTGGIGTTIFYIVGGVLLVGAAILLITKKRMST